MTNVTLIGVVVSVVEFLQGFARCKPCDYSKQKRVKPPTLHNSRVPRNGTSTTSNAKDGEHADRVARNGAICSPNSDAMEWQRDSGRSNKHPHTFVLLCPLVDFVQTFARCQQVIKSARPRGNTPHENTAIESLGILLV